MARARSPQSAQHVSRLDEIDSIEPLGKRMIDRREQVARFDPSTAAGHQLRLDDGRPQPEKPRFLTAGHFDGAIDAGLSGGTIPAFASAGNGIDCLRCPAASLE